MAGVLLNKEQLIALHGKAWYYRHYAGAQFTYQRKQVEMLLVAIWNGGVIDDELHPEHGMPKSKANPAHMGNGPVYMLDLARALEETELSAKTRVAIRLHYGEGLSQTDVGEVLGIAQKNARERIDLGVSRIVATLNGKEMEEEDGTD